MQGPSFFVPRNTEQAQEIQQATQAGSEGIFDFARYLRQNPDKVAEVLTRAGAGALPGAGVAEFSGLAPDIAPGSGYAPGFMDLIKEGKYGDAAAQTALLGLDIGQLSGAMTVPITAAKFGRGLTRGIGSIYDDFTEVDPRRLNISSGRGSDGGDDLTFEQRLERGKKLRQEQRSRDSKEIEKYIDQIDPSLKMFQQPEEVQALERLPSVKDEISIDKGGDDFLTGLTGKDFLKILEKRFSLKPGMKTPNTLSDLSTPELITSWVVEPAKVNRAEVAGRLASDPSAVARTNARLTDLGYGETVPMFRLVGIDDQGNFKPEGLISATLDPKKVPSNINFFTEGKIDMFNPAKHVLVRYDVPREKIAAYLPAVSEDINRNVNKAVKEKGFGQKKLKGLKTVTNPAVHAKNLINAQDEIFADVTGLKPNFLLDNEGQPMNMNSFAALIPKSVAEGDFDTPEDIQKLFGTNNFVLDFRDFTDSDAFEEAESQARQNLVDEYKKFFKAQKFETGGEVAPLPPEKLQFVEDAKVRVEEARAAGGRVPVSPSAKKRHPSGTYFDAYTFFQDVPEVAPMLNEILDQDKDVSEYLFFGNRGQDYVPTQLPRRKSRLRGRVTFPTFAAPSGGIRPIKPEQFDQTSPDQVYLIPDPMSEDRDPADPGPAFSGAGYVTRIDDMKTAAHEIMHLSFRRPKPEDPEYKNVVTGKSFADAPITSDQHIYIDFVFDNDLVDRPEAYIEKFGEENYRAELANLIVRRTVPTRERYSDVFRSLKEKPLQELLPLAKEQAKNAPYFERLITERTKRFASGGIVSLAPIARNMFRGPRALESLAPVARNMDRSMLRSG
jgi:hypothetical protein